MWIILVSLPHGLDDVRINSTFNPLDPVTGSGQIPHNDTYFHRIRHNIVAVR